MCLETYAQESNATHFIYVIHVGLALKFILHLLTNTCMQYQNI